MLRLADELERLRNVQRGELDGGLEGFECLRGDAGVVAQVRAAVDDAMTDGDGRCVREIAQSGKNCGEGFGLGLEEVIAVDEIFAGSVADAQAAGVATDVVGAAFEEELLVV